jgi:NhaP-type Na+/H+ and K+/H+ antiporter
MNDFVFNTLVPALYFIVLLFGAASILFVILPAVFGGKRVNKIFDTIFFVSFVGLCCSGVLLLLTMSISGLIMLCNS